MSEKEVMVLCYWDGSIKYGPDGVYYEGSSHKKISVKQKTEFSKLVEGLYLITGLGNFKIFGKYPVAVSPDLFTYLHLPVVSDSSLHAMLGVPSNHPSINTVELYLEGKLSSEEVVNVNPTACSSPLDYSGNVDVEVTHPAVKLECGNGFEVQGVEVNGDFVNSSSHEAVMDFESLETVATLDAENEVIDMKEHSVTPVIRKRRKISTAWESFEELGVEQDGKERVKCFRCGTKLTIGKNYGTNHLNRHLRRCKKREGDRNSDLDCVAQQIDLTTDDANAEKDLNESGVEAMLNHPSINTVELYLEATPTSNDVCNPAVCSSPLDHSSYVDVEVAHPTVKLECDNGLEVQRVDTMNREANADFGNSSTYEAVMDNNNGKDFESLETIAMLNAENEVIDMKEGSAQIETCFQGSEHSATRVIRKRRKISTVWEGFEDIGVEQDGKERVKCVRCGTKFTIGSNYGTNHLKRHLGKCKKRPKEGDIDCVAQPIDLTANDGNAQKDLSVPGLEAMLDVPSSHPSINTVELYLEATPTSNDVINPAVCSSPLDDVEVAHQTVKLKCDNGLEVQRVDTINGEDFESLEPIAMLNAENEGIDMKEETYLQGPEHSATQVIRKRRKISTVWESFEDLGVEQDGKERAKCFCCGTKLTVGKNHGTNQLNRHLRRCKKMPKEGDRDSGLDWVVQPVILTADNSNEEKDFKVAGLDASANATSSSASKPSSLWVDGNELCEGLCFKDRDELKKVVDWCAIRERRKCVVKETKKDRYVFKCIRWKCNWSLWAARMKEHGRVEIVKCSGPHTCCPTPIGPYNFDVKFAAEEIECVVRVQPLLTVDELNNWWFEKYSYKLKTSEMKTAKQEAIKKIYGVWDQSFRVLPKLMAALQSSNELLVDWQYDLCPNPEFASFRGVFWSFSQSIKGFPHCRPLIIVDAKDLSLKYPMKLMIASGLDANNNYFPLAFAVTKEVSSDSWRWFLNGIRKKVTQRKELCLISSPDPDILAVINEPESQWQEPWAYHRFCLDHLSSQFHDVFQDNYLKNLVDKAGLAMQHDELKSHIESIGRKNPEARRWLEQKPSHQWTLANDGGRRYGIKNINREHLYSVFESFQSLDLSLTATVLLLFDEMRSLFLTGISNSKGSLKCGDVYTVPVMEKLEEFMSASVPHVVMPLEKGEFQVTKPLQKEEWIVQLSECTCTCGEFQSTKFPCMHALAVCEKLKINPLQYVDDCYTLERSCKTYAATFSSVPEVSAWPEASGVPTLFPPTK